MTTLCEACQVGDHRACEQPCECAHACQQCGETGALLGGCACDRGIDRMRGK